MGLRVLRASRPELLLDALAERLGAPTADPLEEHVVGVPTRAFGDWARGEVARLVGVVAGTRFAHPGLLIRLLLGEERDHDDPWTAERMAWTVLAVLGEHPDMTPPGAPWSARPERPWLVARHLAERFEGYGVQRPGMLAAWAAGRDVDGDDGDAIGLRSEMRWQAAVWREVRAAIGSPSPAERLVAVVDGAEPAGGGPVTVFGSWVLGAPGAALLRRVATRRDVAVLAAGPAPRSHPLLARWGRTAAEAAALVADLEGDGVAVPAGGGRIAAATARSDQLGLLRAALDATPEPAVGDGIDPDPEVPRLADDPEERWGDGSVRVHGCHGVTRQLEVVRDALMHEFRADATLRPRDVLVLCADPAAVAPLVGPVLGAEVAGHALPVALDDRALAAPPPVFAAVDRLLAFAAARMDRDQVDAVLALPPVRTALGLDDRDIVLLTSSVAALGVRWGVDGAHRTRWGYPAGRDEDTWLPALERLVAGVLFHPDAARTVPTPRGPLAPAAHLTDPDPAAVGRVHRALEALARVAALGTSRRTPAAWLAALEVLVDDLLVPPSSRDPRLSGHRLEVEQVRAVARDLVRDAAAAGAGSVELDVRELRAALADRLRTPVVASPGPEAIRVAGLTALRGVPARVVALVGLDESSLGAPHVDGDDVLSLRRDRPPGERRPEEAVRSALLDAVLGAERLIVTFDGQNLVTGTEVALATVVEELCDALPDVPVDTRPSVRLVTRHPRHLAHPRNLGIAAPGGDPVGAPGALAWTHQPIARDTLARLRSLGTRPLGAEGLWRVEDGDGWWLKDTDGLPRLEEATHDEVDVDRIRATLRDPAGTFLAVRLGIRLPDAPESSPRNLELWPDGRAEAALGREALTVVRAGGDAEAWAADRPARGGLPPGRIGRRLLADVVAEVVALDAAADRRLGRAVPATFHVALDGGRPRRLRTRAALEEGIELDLAFVRDHPVELVGPWLRLLVVAAASDGAGHEHAVLQVRRGSPGKGPVLRRLSVAGATPEERAATGREVLGELVRLEGVLRRRPAAVFGRATWALVAGWSDSKVKEDLKRDVGSPATRAVLGRTDLVDLGRQRAGAAETALPDRDRFRDADGDDAAVLPPVRRWAEALRGLRDRSLVVEEVA